ncbi:MAG: LptF/LptG family permease [Bacteroidota bacterium]
MKTNKLTYAFDEKIFNYDFQNLAIRIGKKDDDGRGLHDILIYDMSDYDKSITHVIKAQTGKMYTTPDGKYLVMELDSGYHFQEQRSEIADKSRLRSNLQGRPVLRYAFSSLRKTFSLEKLIQVKQTQSSYRTYELMNSIKLLATIDTIQEELYTIRQSNVTPFQVLDTTSRSTPSTELYKAPPPLSPNESSQQTLAQLQRAEPKLKQLDINTSERLKLPASITSRYEIKKDDINKRTRSLHDILVFPDRDNFYDNVSKRAQSFLSKNSGSKQNDRKHSRDLAIHTYTFHRMYSWAVVCVIFLFVGGPAGAIVKKGGFGYPLLIAIGFYLAFVMTQIIGNKLVLGGSMDPIVGAWLPCLVLLPFAVYLTWRALLDNRRLVRWSLLSKLYKTTSSPSAGM